MLYILLILILAYNIAHIIWLRKHPDYYITFIASEIGSGKSCYAAMLAKKHIKKGWKVFSTEYIQGCYKFNIEHLKNFKFPEKSLIIMDEASLKMNSRKFVSMPIEIIEYMKLSRHYKNKVIFISQTFSDTDKQIRELASKILFIRPISRGWISMPVKVKSRLGVGINNEIQMQYKVGHFGKPFILPKYFKYYQSYNTPNRPKLSEKCWSE